MLIRVGLELNTEGRALAWALDLPGCFAYGSEGPDAVIALARELVTYEEWVTGNGGPGWLNLGNFDLRLVDTWTVYSTNDRYEVVEDGDGYTVNAWFRTDWQPLEAEEIERALEILDWSRADLLEAVRGLDDAAMDRKRTGERWSIRGILKHIGSAEWWYQDRLGLAEGSRETLSTDAFERLEQTRRRTKIQLPLFAGAEQVVGKEGEFWSPRKFLRRTIWHEIDHRQHILKLLHESVR